MIVILSLSFQDMTNWFINSNLLPNKLFPIIFDSIAGVCKKLDGSCFNIEEVHATMEYLNRILDSKIQPSDIGILFICYIIHLFSFIYSFAFQIFNFRHYFAISSSMPIVEKRVPKNQRRSNRHWNCRGVPRPGEANNYHLHCAHRWGFGICKRREGMFFSVFFLKYLNNLILILILISISISAIQCDDHAGEKLTYHHRRS